MVVGGGGGGGGKRRKGPRLAAGVFSGRRHQSVAVMNVASSHVGKVGRAAAGASDGRRSVWPATARRLGPACAADRMITKFADEPAVYRINDSALQPTNLMSGALFQYLCAVQSLDSVVGVVRVRALAGSGFDLPQEREIGAGVTRPLRLACSRSPLRCGAARYLKCLRRVGENRVRCDEVNTCAARGISNGDKMFDQRCFVCKYFAHAQCKTSAGADSTVNRVAVYFCKVGSVLLWSRARAWCTVQHRASTGLPRNAARGVSHGDVVVCLQYDDGIHPYMENPPPSMYDPHVAHRPLQGIAHHSPHVNHGMHQYHAANHVAPVANHVMGAVPDVHKRDKDAIYG
ncbi:hypothetical protein PR048_017064 [Dryococelus australis]|uniref:Uncharacterized protein n=1 Tax=Dryococelus australis TaxID=614101 RepID=A0ABQ9H8G2_9NEOP|nr:hypothetical protein PR048_017064 [Dryococelus australis]